MYKYSHTTHKKKGFTLIELIVSVFIFLLIMLAVVTIFVKEVEAFRNAKQSQRSIENAQFAMNFVAKTLRTSIVTRPTDQTSGRVSEVYAYDFSQQACFHFYFEGSEEALYYAKAATTFSGVAGTQNRVCNTSSSFGPAIKLTTGTVTGGFYGAPSDEAEGQLPARMGRMTVMMAVEPPAYQRDQASAARVINVQTTVSLRDYENAGLRQ